MYIFMCAKRKGHESVVVVVHILIVSLSLNCYIVFIFNVYMRTLYLFYRSRLGGHITKFDDYGHHHDSLIKY